MAKYIAYISCDATFFNQLEGKYSILKYTLEPCKITERNQHRGTSNFTISYEFEGLPEKGLPDNERVHNSFINKQIAIEEAKIFVAWFSTAVRRPLDLSHVSFGGTQEFGPSGHYLVEEFDREIVKRIFHLKEDIKEGTYRKVTRPDYKSVIKKDVHILRVPEDFSKLSKKLYSLPTEIQEKFFDSCLSYQFALINSLRLPSISLVALVNVVESIMRDRYSSGYCEDTGKLCPHKRDVMKKFRTFFEENLQYPLPEDKRRFLNEVYQNRSNIVHETLMGSGPFRGPIYLGLAKDIEFKDQLHEFETLVNVGMINWLNRL